jgi:hypothetical protein
MDKTEFMIGAEEIGIEEIGIKTGALTPEVVGGFMTGMGDG